MSEKWQVFCVKQRKAKMCQNFLKQKCALSIWLVTGSVHQITN